ncbi:MAG: DUF1385 domain-containing protein [Anaerolineae bacterium]
MSRPQFNYGGQALLEGVMMRGSTHMAAAVRKPDGEIELYAEPLDSPLYNGWLSKVPFVRGLGLLWDSLGLGLKALFWSANLQLPEDSEERIEGGAVAGTVATSFTIAIGLFFLLPAGAASGIESLFGVDSAVIGNLIEGVIRLALVIGYVAATGLIPDVRRLYAYHGAEHKTINAYEAGAALDPESVDRFPVTHPRCGTGFLLIVVLLTILIGVLLGDLALLPRLASRVLLIPIVAGIAYEYIKLLARHMDSPIVRILVWPQLAMQRLTTREPTADMLAVAIVALERVLAAEGLPATTQEPEPVLRS